MKTLYASDLDGTLLTKEEAISSYSLGILNRLIDAGMTFTFATARSASSAWNAVRGLNFNAPVVLYNGGLIYDFAKRRTLRAVLFDGDVKNYVMSVLKEHGIMPFVFGAAQERERVVWKAGAESLGMVRYLYRRRTDPRMEPVSSEAEMLGGYTFYFKCIGPKEQLEGAWNVLKYDPRVICIFHQETYQNDFWMEISPREATKANAVSFLKYELGCDRVVCFGDSSNDSDLFDVCDEKYAVRNADGWLKDKATCVIGYCEEDGVAKWLAANFAR
ncbi:MAG: HAD family hydrolase [Clostridia bacterium]|nr:HAD family hydrolase [Clostridia bacterium]